MLLALVEMHLPSGVRLPVLGTEFAWLSGRLVTLLALLAVRVSSTPQWVRATTLGALVLVCWPFAAGPAPTYRATAFAARAAGRKRHVRRRGRGRRLRVPLRVEQRHVHGLHRHGLRRQRLVRHRVHNDGSWRLQRTRCVITACGALITRLALISSCGACGSASIPCCAVGGLQADGRDLVHRWHALWHRRQGNELR